VWLQKTQPLALAEGLRVEALYERIPDLVDQLVGEADTLLSEVSDVLDRFYQQDLRPRLGTLRPSWGYVFDVRAGRERALEPFRQISGYVGADEKGKVEGVFVVQDGVATFRRVTVGITGEKDFEVVGGLSAGDVIVTGPFKALREIKDGDIKGNAPPGVAIFMIESLASLAPTSPPETGASTA
jgi:hypothetical protein